MFRRSKERGTRFRLPFMRGGGAADRSLTRNSWHIWAFFADHSRNDCYCPPMRTNQFKVNHESQVEQGKFAPYPEPTSFLMALSFRSASCSRVFCTSQVCSYGFEWWTCNFASSWSRVKRRVRPDIVPQCSAPASNELLLHALLLRVWRLCTDIPAPSKMTATRLKVVLEMETCQQTSALAVQGMRLLLAASWLASCFGFEVPPTQNCRIWVGIWKEKPLFGPWGVCLKGAERHLLSDYYTAIRHSGERFRTV